jgi:hypothetical protein
VRALFFLHAVHRFQLPNKPGFPQRGLIPFQGHEHLLHRRFNEAIDCLRAPTKLHGPSDATSSALAAAYQRLAFQTLADQVRRSVRTVRGNQWMFRVGHPLDQPLRIRPELLRRQPGGGYPILREQTPGADGPEPLWLERYLFSGNGLPGRRAVLNVSIDLGVHGRDSRIRSSARRGLSPNHRGTPAPAHERRSRGHLPISRVSPRSSISPATTSAS